MVNNKDNKDVVQQENKKLYPKSFRITDEVYKAFRDISKSFNNQDEALKQLCQCYEMNANNSVLPVDIQADVQKFNNYMGVIQRLYINSLEYTNVVKDSEQERYKAELDLKDSTINDLEVKINNLNNDKENLEDKMKDLSQMNNQSKQELKHLQEELSNTTSDFQDRLRDKEQVIASLNKTIKDLEGNIIDLKDKANAYTELQSENVILKEQLDENKKEIEKLKIDNDKKLLKAKEEYNKKYEDINNKHIKEIESYSDKYNKLLMKIEKITLFKENEN